MEVGENTDRLKREILAALKAEQWDDALPLLESWCERFPGHSRSWLNRGYCLVHLDRFRDAVAALDRCLELDPTSTSARSWRDHALAALDRAASQPDRTEAAEDAATRNASVPRVEAPPTYATMASPAGTRGWLAGTVVNGRYEVQSVARGGMAVVAIAFDRELRRMVAVKTPLPSVLATEDGKTRFQREAESWIALGVHPNICSAYYIQEIGGMPRLFVEYIDGGDLGQWLRGGEKRSLEEKLDIAIQVASGIDYTHNFKWTDAEGTVHKGLVHRDIKPANVLLTSDGIARVTDFGLVRVEGVVDEPASPDAQPADPALPHVGRKEDTAVSGSWQTVTVAGGLVGTPPYMAPELWMQTLRGTISTDVYAYGCMLYEIFCGHRPFVMDTDATSQTREANLGEWMRMHLHGDPADPRELVEDLEPRLVSVLKTCVSKDAGRRPQSFTLIRNWLVDIYGEVVGRPYPRPEPQRTQLLADSLNNRAVSYITLDQVDRARDELRAALEVDPRHLDATFNSALLEWWNDGLTDAEMERRIGEAERATGNTDKAGLLRAHLRLLIDDPGGAAESLRARSSDASSSLAAWRELGLALAASARAGRGVEELEEGRNLLAAVLEKSPSDLAVAIGFAELCELLGNGEMAGEVFSGLKKLDQDLGENLADAVAGHLPGHRVDRSLGHQAPVQSVLATPDGRVVVRTAAADAVIWGQGNEKPEHRVELGGPARQGRSMTVDGNSLVVCLENGPLTLFDLATWERQRNLQVHPGVATCVATSPAGGSLATGGSDRCLRLWDVGSGECVRTLQGHEAFVSAVLWPSSLQGVITASADGTLRVWDLEQGRCGSVLEGHRGPIRAIAIDENERRLVSAGQDGSIGMWDLTDGSFLRWLRGHRGAVTTVVFVDGAVVAGGEDGTLRIWNAENGRSQRVFRLANPIQDVVQFGDRRVLAAHGTSVSEIEMPRPRALPLPLVLSDTVMSGELAGREEAFAGHLQTARLQMRSGKMEEAISSLRDARRVPGYELHSEALSLWSEALAYFPKSAVRSVVEVRRIECGAEAQTACSVAPDGTVVSGGVDGKLRVFDASSGTQIHIVEGHSPGITSVDSSRDGRLVASAGRDGAIRIWNTDDGECVRTLEGHRGSVHDVVFTSRGEVASAGEDGSIRLWPLEEGALPELLADGGDAVLAVTTSDDGRYLVSAGWDSQITVWSARTRAELRKLEGHEGAINAVAVSSDCRVIASAGEDGTLRLWDLEGGRCWRVLRGHEGAVQAVAFTPDARFVVSAGKDSTLRLWDLRTGSGVMVVEGHAGPVAAFALDRDGGAAVSAGIDASLRLWFLDWEPEPPGARAVGRPGSSVPRSVSPPV